MRIRSVEDQASEHRSVDQKDAERSTVVPGSGADCEAADREVAGRLIITRIAPQRRAGRVSVYINEEFVFGCDLSALASLHWREGQILSPVELSRAQDEIEYRAARAAAEMFLGYRARSEQEVTRRLTEKGYSPIAVGKVLEYLKQEGYVNDEDFAASYVGSASFRTMGRKRIVSELRRKGIEPEVVTAAVTSLDDETERELALEFARRRAAGMSHLDATVSERRLTAALGRRGFSYSTIRAVIKQVIDHDEAE